MRASSCDDAQNATWALCVRENSVSLPTASTHRKYIYARGTIQHPGGFFWLMPSGTICCQPDNEVLDFEIDGEE
jgi:hypothetical protein